MAVTAALRKPLAWGAAVLALAVFGGSAAADPATGRRAAVVVGNAGYIQVGSLANPRNDAGDMAATLRELGFDVLRVEDARQAEMAALAARIPAHMEGASIGVFYYAGHALQYSGVNYLLPVDLTVGTPDAVLAAALPLNAVLERMGAAGVGVRILILDACRDNPLGDRAGVFGEGLALVEHGAGETLIAYATAAGSTAADGIGPNSPYTGALISALAQPGWDIYQVFRQVRAQVRQATNGQQLPWVSGSLESEVQLNAGRPMARADRPAPDAVTVDTALWDFIQNSQDAGDFRLFVALFPQSPHAGVAREAMDRLPATLYRSLDGSGGPAPAAAEPPAILATTGDRSPPPALRAWPRRLPAVAEGLATRVGECDLLAADPDDPARIVPGVQMGLVNIRAAVRACGAALAREPDNPRLLFQFGRALDAARRYEWAEAFYRQAGERGYGAALVNLGYLHRTGRGRPRDDAEAARLYRRAAELGNPRGRTNLGKMYEEGWGVPRSNDEALLWYRLAGAQGWPNALDSLGNMVQAGQGVPADPAQAVELYEAAAALGQTNAMNNLGLAHLRGRGVPADPAAALRWLTRAAERGNSFAPFHLARLYRDGGPVPRDAARAAALLRLSADRGHAPARTALAELLAAGAEGLPADPGEAAYQYHLAAAAGHAPAQAGLAALERTLPPEVAEAARRRARLWIEQNGD
ncbi:MAG TPA: caspase family protein [Alphaproteobacteria bacterium]|nr:caspase family protein [Alphaproteobacteria bacterium]